jgi:photosystem II stability/assembly factor-like uncharacterized protein
LTKFSARRMLAAIAATLISGAAFASKRPEPAAKPSPSLSDELGGLEFRNIGPFRGGRVTAVAGVIGSPMTFYFGATGGGVWKTVDGGDHWAPVSDGFFRTGSIGAIAVAASDPNVVYVGTGEAAIRGNLSEGDGVWRSTDAGATWNHLGLDNTRQISRVRIDPSDPDRVFVAAQGEAWGPNPERGIYRSTDGGKNWQRVLFVDDRTGASDLAMDPRNPRILYAAFWQVVRRPWTLESGGSASGLYKSADGGDTWTKLAGGLPQGIVGKIGVAPSAAREGRVWAIVESKEEGGVYRTDDAGKNWSRVNSENKLRQRAWYYSEIYADPKSADAVYVLNTGFYRSGDGGSKFEAIPVPHGDNHDLWLDPDNPGRMIESNDGGADVSFNGGGSWSTEDNQPTAQFYRVATDDRFPYWVYGAQQDNTSVAIPSAASGRGIERTDWYPVGGCESGWIAPKPKDPDVVYSGCYGGSITRFDHRTGQEREVVAWPQLAIGQAARDLKYRFQWNAPILVSRFDSKTVYHAAQKLLRSRDEGWTWQEISPDLTRNDRSKQGYSGGPITFDDTGIEVYDTIFALAEGRDGPDTIWAGTDDGLVQLTRDGGRTWTNVTPPGIPEWIQINAIEVSPHDPATAFVAATMYKLGDPRPYAYKTHDYGKHWTKITDGIAPRAFVRVIREDGVRRGLLYAGTERGLYVSFDEGAHWTPFPRNLPPVPITDLAVKDGDLVVATQGRAFWILDDLVPLEQWTGAIAAEEVHFFPVRPAYRLDLGGDFGGEGAGAASGKNPPDGAILDVWFREKPPEADPVTIEILAGGKLLRRFESGKEKAPDGDADSEPGEPGRVEKPLQIHAGLNRFVWDLRMFPPTLVPKAILWGSRKGPRVSPGRYQARLTVGKRTWTQEFEVRANPALGASKEDLDRQFDLLQRVRDALSETHASVIQIRAVKGQIEAALGRARDAGKAGDVEKAARGLEERLTAIEDKLVNPKIRSGQDVLNFPPKLDHQFVGLASVVASAEAAPTPASEEYFRQVRGELDAIESDLHGLLTAGVEEFNRAVASHGIGAVVVPPRERPEDPRPGAARE